MGGTLRLLAEMLQRRLTHRVISFSAATGSSENVQQLGDALRLLAELPQHCVTRNVISLNAGISACE